MCLALLGPVVVILLSIKLKLKIETNLLVSLCRSIVQLLLAGNVTLLLVGKVSEKKYESETRLAFGSSQYEAVLPVVRAAILAALLPNLNQMAVIGLVAIPGNVIAIVRKKHIHSYIRNGR